MGTCAGGREKGEGGREGGKEGKKRGREGGRVPSRCDGLATTAMEISFPVALFVKVLVVPRWYLTSSAPPSSGS